MSDVVAELDALIAVEPRTPAYPLIQRARDEIVALRDRYAGLSRNAHAKRDLALEEAAQACDQKEPDWGDVFAAAIRALKDRDNAA